MDNLARTAGYRDPQRLAWAMEAEAVAVGDHTGRAKELRRQAQRMRASLEQASVRGDQFMPGELVELMANPLLAPMLHSLLLVCDEGVIGLPAADGRVWEHADGETRDLRSTVRIAHPTDLLASGTWPRWQRTLFERRVRQPFKQVFRELYLPAAAERGGVTASPRYAGHQVHRRQATALFASRGWLVSRDEGMMRTFHDERLTARVALLDSPFAPVEGMTLDTVWFSPTGDRRPLPMEQVPPRLFSEVMRDIDLVVSVAHAGGFDPEASASTVEQRRSLVAETARLLRLDNVELTSHYVLIAGKLGDYSVHLGSAVVHRRPGNALCLVPVSAQHRGRLFLPFADDDPRTAEVVSKVVLLARDDRIKDPTVLEQLPARGVGTP